MVLIFELALALFVLVGAGLLFVVGMALYRELKKDKNSDDTKSN